MVSLINLMVENFNMGNSSNDSKEESHSNGDEKEKDEELETQMDFSMEKGKQV
jgi:hypothetical protein